jgi:hypothetical protein
VSEVQCTCYQRPSWNCRKHRGVGDELSPAARLELLKQEARKHRVGEVVEVAGEKLLRVDARKGKQQHRWSYPVEQKKIEFR